jgi:hypothetical protein
VIGYVFFAIGCSSAPEELPGVTAAPETNVEASEPIVDAPAAGVAVGAAIDAAEARALLEATPSKALHELDVAKPPHATSFETKTVTSDQGAVR